MATALLAGTALSYGLELLQHLLAQRVPSSLDWLLNTAGALLGALVAALVRWIGLLRWWQGTRERWLESGNGGALALLVLWPVALLFPTPVPLGVGQAGEALRTTLLDLLADVPWADPMADWLASSAPSTLALSPAAEGLAVVLGLLSPCLLAFAAARPGWRRVGLVAGLLAVAVAATSLSTVLNFGPAHALAWRTPATERALGVAAALALVALTGLVVLVHLAPTDPYFADSLQGWEQGQFVRFHGLAQWVGWLWPYAALAWLLARLGSR